MSDLLSQPVELLLRQVCSLDLKDLGSLWLVNTSTATLFSDDYLWKVLLKRDYPHLTETKNCKERYQQLTVYKRKLIREFPALPLPDTCYFQHYTNLKWLHQQTDDLFFCSHGCQESKSAWSAQKTFPYRLEVTPITSTFGGSLEIQTYVNKERRKNCRQIRRDAFLLDHQDDLSNLLLMHELFCNKLVTIQIEYRQDMQLLTTLPHWLIWVSQVGWFTNPDIRKYASDHVINVEMLGREDTWVKVSGECIEAIPRGNEDLPGEIFSLYSSVYFILD